MPLVRVEVRNQYGLGLPELYREADKEDPKAVLDGVAVAGLVGILRQLGDLAENVKISARSETLKIKNMLVLKAFLASDKSNVAKRICVFNEQTCRFDTGGPGSCLKRYSDPTFFKIASAGLTTEAHVEKVPLVKKAHKNKVYKLSFT
ncbi:hypothetical protein RJ639_017501 [Escallonia herrerae]|uniref:Uncharacterized protein n=1 Tax=Escallonia herrerae TaxID=1293975 RepID=A0AA89ALS2_9ASTE|nr:hypothetical protein RJ639_017501 [Escallonia herrerae]